MTTSIDDIGDYCLVQYIGRGGMGEVWLVVRRKTTSPYAMKILLPELADDATTVEMFRREAEIGAQLGRHGSIVGVHEFGEELFVDPEGDRRLLYLVLDFVDGVNLRRLAERVYKQTHERLPIPIVVHIIRVVLRALDAAHNHRIGSDALSVVHGDINPGNILVSSRGEVRVTDFGVARFAPEITWTSRPVGTLRYMAPEQYLGRVCPQMDLYGAGALLHELLTGEPPVPKCESPRQLERALLEGPVPSLTRTDVPAALDRLRRGLLEKDVGNRIQTAREGLALLAEVGQSDVQDDIKNLYVRTIGPPKSGLTKFLQEHQGAARSGSFVMDMLRRREAIGSGLTLVRGAAGQGRGTSGAAESEADADEEEELAPWLVDDEEDGDEDERTALVLRPSESAVSATVRLGALSPPEAPADTSVPPSAVDTLRGHVPPAPEASVKAPPSDSGSTAPATQTPRRTPPRYPPRPKHLADGVPFQRMRPRSAQRHQASPPDPVSDISRESWCVMSSAGWSLSSSSNAAQESDSSLPTDVPERRDASATSPEASRATLPVLFDATRTPASRWARPLVVALTTALLVTVTLGLLGWAFAAPEPALASSSDGSGHDTEGR